MKQIQSGLHTCFLCSETFEQFSNLCDHIKIGCGTENKDQQIQPITPPSPLTPIKPKILTSTLTTDSITFGKYKGLTLQNLLKDRKYCDWLKDQEWFRESYSYIHKQVLGYDPLSFFLDNKYRGQKQDYSTVELFLCNYPYFNLIPEQDLKIPLSIPEKACYEFYLEEIEILKQKVMSAHLDGEDNPYNIKAPSGWLKRFERVCALSRDIFKEFITGYDLPNITKIVEEIKAVGGLVYNGAKAYTIAKEKSLNQEKYWEQILRKVHGEFLGTQFKYGNCVFDFISIKDAVLYECKLGLKDFNRDQHEKYARVLGGYKLIYLISTDCIIDLGRKTIWTTNGQKYLDYFGSRKITKFDQVVMEFPIVEVDLIEEFFEN